MSDYIVLSGCVTIFGLLLAYSLASSKTIFDSKVLVTLVILLALTAVFDSLIIAAGIVGYDTQRILGLYIGRAPIEDFLYTIVVVPLSIAFWRFYGKQK